MQEKISARRYGRLLSVLYLKDSISNLDTVTVLEVPPLYLEKLTKYLPDYQELPKNIQQKIVNFANQLVSSIIKDHQSLIQIITQNSKNRNWDKFLPIDKALLLVGLSNLQTDPASHLIIKETLIVSDLLSNNNAAPYLSGILKTIAFSPDFSETVKSSQMVTDFKKSGKIRLKNNPSS